MSVWDNVVTLSWGQILISGEFVRGYSGFVQLYSGKDKLPLVGGRVGGGGSGHVPEKPRRSTTRHDCAWWVS